MLCALKEHKRAFTLSRVLKSMSFRLGALPPPRASAPPANRLAHVLGAGEVERALRELTKYKQDMSRTGKDHDSESEWSSDDENGPVLAPESKLQEMLSALVKEWRMSETEPVKALVLCHPWPFDDNKYTKHRQSVPIREMTRELFRDRSSFFFQTFDPA